VRVLWTISREKPQEALRRRLREIAATHVRYGYRPLTVLLRREGWKINARRLHRLYDDENLKVRSIERKKIARRQPVSQAQAHGDRITVGWRISSATSCPPAARSASSP